MLITIGKWRSVMDAKAAQRARQIAHEAIAARRGSAKGEADLLEPSPRVVPPGATEAMEEPFGEARSAARGTKRARKARA